MASVRQASFAGGEIAPELSGRSDVERFGVSVRTLRNFLPLPYGPAQNRPGTVFVAKTKFSAAGVPVRLVPFVFGAGQSYVLEFGVGYVRFYSQGAQLQVGGSAYELVTPYVGADLARLKVAQCGDVLTICHPAHPAMELKRLSHLSWTLSAVDFSSRPAFFLGGTPRLAPAVELEPSVCMWREDDAHVAKPWQWAVSTICEDLASGRRFETSAHTVVQLRYCGYDLYDQSVRYVADDAPAWSAGFQYAAHDGVSYNGKHYWAKQASQNLAPSTNPAAWQEAPTRFSTEGITGAWFTPKANLAGEHGGSRCYYDHDTNQTNPDDDAPQIFWDRRPPVWQTNDNLSVDGPVCGITTAYGLPTKIALAPDQPVRLTWPAPDPKVLPDGFRVLAFRVYRGQGGIFGWVGDVDPKQGGPEPWEYLKTYKPGDIVSHDGYVYRSQQSANAEHEPLLEPVMTPIPEKEEKEWWRPCDWPFRSFIDAGEDPDYTVQPPSGKNPFSNLDEDGSVDHEEIPAVVAYHEQRRVFGNTFDPSLERGRPATLFGSRLGDFGNFDRRDLVVLPSDAFDLTLATRGYEEIRSLVSLRRLLVFTSGGEWVAGGSGGAPLSPLSLDVRAQSAFGSTWLDPLVVGAHVLYVQEAGHRVRELSFSADSDGYQSRDLTLWSRHLLAYRQVVDWTFAREPHGLVWAVRDDGLLLSCTYEPEQQVLAWGWHDTLGAFQAIASVPELVTSLARVTLPAGGGYGHEQAGALQSVTHLEDAVYVVVRRQLGSAVEDCIERFASRRFLDVRDGVFVDCAVGYDGRNRDPALTAACTAVVAGEWDVGDEVYVNGATKMQFGLGGWVGKKFVLEPDGASPISILVSAVDQQGGYWRLRGALDQALPVRLQGESGRAAAWARADNVLPAPHLEGLTVAVLEDGVPVTAVVAAGGAIALTGHRVVVRAGLPYLCDLELNDLAVSSAELRTKTKTVREVAFEVFGTRGLSAGETFDRLQAWAPPAPATNGYQGTTGLVRVRIANSWNTHGRACLRQSLPLPITVLAAVREVDVGG